MNNNIYTDEENARIFCAAIKELANKPENLENLELYLSHHFSEWMEKYAYDPDCITGELKNFAKMDLKE